MATGSGNSSTSSGSNTTTACAACKYQRRKCTADCPLSPYFPPDQPRRFQNVHRLFGVSNILRILKHVDPGKRDDAVKSIAYEADTREKDPVHGCLGVITILQNQVSKLKDELAVAREQLCLLQQQHHHNFNQQAQMQQIVGSLGGSTSVVNVSSAPQETSGVLMQYSELGNSDHYSLKSSNTPLASAPFEPDQYLRTDNFDVKPAASARFDVNARYTRAAGASHTSRSLVLQHHQYVKLAEEQPATHYMNHGSITAEDPKPAPQYATAIRRNGLFNLSMATSDSGVYLSLTNN